VADRAFIVDAVAPGHDPNPPIGDVLSTAKKNRIAGIYRGDVDFINDDLFYRYSQKR